MAILWMDGFDHYIKKQDVIDVLSADDERFISAFGNASLNPYISLGTTDLYQYSTDMNTSLTSAGYTVVQKNGYQNTAAYGGYPTSMLMALKGEDDRGRCLCLSTTDSTNHSISRTFAWSGSFYVGFKFRATFNGTLSGYYAQVIQLMSGDNTVGRIAVSNYNNGGVPESRVYIKTNDSGNNGDEYMTDTSKITDKYIHTEWNFMEVQVDTVNEILRVWINNYLCSELPLNDSVTMEDLQKSTTVTFGDSFTTSTAALYKLSLDNLYVLDSTGDINNRRLGIIDIYTRKPTVDTVAEFSRDTGDNNFEMVNDDAPDGDESIVYSSDAGVKDLYTSTEELPNYPVLAVGVTINARRTGGDSRAIKPILKSGNTELQGGFLNLKAVEYTMGTEILNYDPDTKVQWTNTGAINAQFGFRLSE